MVSLQNIPNKGVICKIVQDKELRVLFVSAGRFRVKDAAWMIEENF